MFAKISELLGHHWMAAPLGIWGKLPEHGDFLRHNTSAAQAQAWQDWTRQVWSQRAPTPLKQRRQSLAHAKRQWLSLEPAQAQTHLADVPVAFVMQPGTLAFAPKHCVQGVVVDSCDQIGRPCPLIIYQQITPAWLRRTWGDGVYGSSRQGMLYWLARIAARTHGGNQGWSALVRAVDSLWQLHQPGWRHLAGASLPAPTGLQLSELLHQFCPDETSDLARGLQGVGHMPWAHWPTQIVRKHLPTQAYWQQDMQGGYVNASEHLVKLWDAQA